MLNDCQASNWLNILKINKRLQISCIDHYPTLDFNAMHNLWQANVNTAQKTAIFVGNGTAEQAGFIFKFNHRFNLKF